jgi:hypothetical protein
MSEVISFTEHLEGDVALGAATILGTSARTVAKSR